MPHQSFSNIAAIHSYAAC